MCAPALYAPSAHPRQAERVKCFNRVVERRSSRNSVCSEAPCEPCPGKSAARIQPLRACMERLYGNQLWDLVHVSFVGLLGCWVVGLLGGSVCPFLIATPCLRLADTPLNWPGTATTVVNDALKLPSMFSKYGTLANNAAGMLQAPTATPFFCPTCLPFPFRPVSASPPPAFQPSSACTFSTHDAGTAD